MSSSLTTTDLKALLGFPFRDANWQKKFLMGSLVVLAGFAVPLVPYMALYGYLMQIMRRIIIDGSEPYLPEWEDWGNLLTDGIKLFGAIFVFMMPVFVVLGIGYAFFFASMMATGVLAGTFEQGDEAAGAMVTLLPLTGGLVIILTFAVVMLLSLALGAVLPVVMGHVVATNELGAVFRWREWWPIFRANLSGFLIADVIILALSLGLNAVLFMLYLTFILCCLIPIIIAPATMYVTVIHSAVFARAYREGVRKLKNQSI